MDRIAELEALILALAERLYACFELLARNAERKEMRGNELQRIP